MARSAKDTKPLGSADDGAVGWGHMFTTYGENPRRRGS